MSDSRRQRFEEDLQSATAAQSELAAIGNLGGSGLGYGTLLCGDIHPWRARETQRLGTVCSAPQGTAGAKRVLISV